MLLESHFALLFSHFVNLRSGMPGIVGRINCATFCHERAGCSSFFYNSDLRKCLTSTRRYQNTRGLSAAKGYSYYIVTWTPHTCTDVLKKNPNAKDGEYKLFPTAPQFSGQPVKIYCKMTGRIPKEYVTLVNKNYGVYPNVSATKSCRGKKPLTGDERHRPGETYFTKLRVQPQTMSVIIGDEAFISTTQQERWLEDKGYGKALDCYSDVCDPQGTFFINTLGTGMKFSQQLTWKGHGYKPRVLSVEREKGGAVINLRCGGFCGGCSPNGDMVLYPNAMDGSN